MKKIYFKGYYGNKNLGDDIFTITAEYICRVYWDSYQPIFVGRYLPKLSEKSKIITVKNDRIRRLYELFILFYSSNIFYFGGSLFSNGGKTIKDLKYIIRKSKYLRNKTSALGVSIGPFLSKKDFETTKQFIEKIKYIGVRDSLSNEALKNMGIVGKNGFSFDIAILLSDIYPELMNKKRNNESIKIGISLTRNNSEFGRDYKNERERESTLIKTLNNLIESNQAINKLAFIEFNGDIDNGDSEVTDEFLDLFKDKVETQKIKYSKDTKSFLKEFSECDFIIGTRLHSGIIAYSLDIPFILIEYHNKCTEFLNTINHGYKFSNYDSEINVKNINYLLEGNGNEQMKDFRYFKKIMIDELESIKSIL